MVKRQWLTVVLVFAMGFALCSCNEPSADLPVSVAKEVANESVQEFDGMVYTLLETDADYVSEGKYAAPKTGYRFVTVKLQYDNRTDVAKEVSSLLMLSVLDEEGHEYPITITVTDLPETLDGTVAPQSSLTGYAAFEVPQTTEHLNLQIRPNLFSDEVVAFVLF